ncbi:hypothetical protein [Paenibacillus albus]|nr:hypothetical protein [Paenibacillus albus]
MITTAKEQATECDWITLFLQAKAMGITVEEIRVFIETCQLQKKAN